MLVNKLPAALADKKERLEELLYTSNASSSGASSYSVTAIIEVIGIYLNTALTYALQARAAKSGNRNAGREYGARNQTCHACARLRAHLRELPYNLLGMRREVVPRKLQRADQVHPPVPAEASHL